MVRSHCVLCDSSNLETIYIQRNAPVSIGCSVHPFENDIFTDMHYLLCGDCACVQIANPVSQQALYKESHNNTYNTPTWAQHHESLCDFILSNARGSSFVEIGGSSGVLAKKIIQKHPSSQYSIIDLCDSNPKIDGVSFIHANCEEYTYTAKSTVLLSHVFEHLYTPLLFLQKLETSTVSEVILSIPNMEVSLQNASLSFLHVEHTFYIDTQRLCAMFSKYNFVCVNTFRFKDHSLFFHFVKSEECVPISKIEEIEKTKQQFHTYFKLRNDLFINLHISTPFFIVPSGHFGQFLYSSLQNYKDLMVGFLDNDPSKIGKRLYGTHLSVYSMKEVQNYKEGISIVIHSGPYLQEIKKQLLDYNHRLTFIEIYLPNDFNGVV